MKAKLFLVIISDNSPSGKDEPEPYQAIFHIHPIGPLARQLRA
jgi:hypothetical protein